MSCLLDSLYSKYSWLPLADILRTKYYDAIMAIALEADLANCMIFALEG